MDMTSMMSATMDSLMESTMDMTMDTTMNETMDPVTDDMTMNMNADGTMNHSNMAASFCTSHMANGVGMNHGAGMIMYMDGFRASLKGDQPCLNLFFPGWTLDTRGKFVGAMFGIIMLGIFVEGVSKFRHRISRSARIANRSPDQKSWNPHVLRWTITALHGSQALVGYILMLATMTFSVELLFSAIVGLSLGYAIFFQTEQHYLESSAHVTTNPCCGFMEEEAKELRSEHNEDTCSDGTPPPVPESVEETRVSYETIQETTVSDETV